MNIEDDNKNDQIETNLDWIHRIFMALLNSEFADQVKGGLAFSFPMPGLSGEKKVIRVFQYPASSYKLQYGAPINHFCLHAMDLTVIACHEVLEFDKNEVFSWEEDLLSGELQQERIRQLMDVFDGILDEAFTTENNEVKQYAKDWLADLEYLTGSQYRFYQWLSPEYIDWALSD